MKTKSMHKGLAVVLAIVMMLALIPVTSLSMKASADAATHVLNATSDVPNIQDKGVVKDGDTYTADNGYFTVYCGKDARFDKSAWKTDTMTNDFGFDGTQRINFNGGIDASKPANCIGFTTTAAATVKVWWAKGDADRQIVIMDSTGKQVAVTDFGGAKNERTLSTLKVPGAGKYLLGNTPKSNYIFKIEVTEEAAAAAGTDYTVKADDLTVASPITGESKAGTKDYFTIKWGSKGRVVADTENKLPDGTVFKQNFDFNGGTTSGKDERVIEFKAADKGQVKIWWKSGGDDRFVQLYSVDDAAVVGAAAPEAKSAYAIYTVKFDKAGTYHIEAPKGTCSFYQIVVTEGEVAEAARADWSKVAAPVITSAAQEKDADGNLTDNVKVTVNAAVGNNGGDAVKVILTDANGKEVTNKQSVAEKDSHDIVLPASKTGTYSVKAVLSREGETDKESAAANVNFTLTLKATTISSVTNKGNGKVSVKWDPVDEAESYIVYAAGKEVKSNTTSAVVEGLNVGDKVEFTVAAVRGSETGKKSDPLTATITKEEQQEWGFTAYGTSTGKTKNTCEGNLNEGSVTVNAMGGAGKLNQAADDGISFYYTAIPANKNFTFRAKIHVDTWTWSNGQEAFGLAAVDMLPAKSFDTSHWTNVYYTAVGRDGNGRQGVSAMSKTGITPENWQAVKDNTFDRTKLYSPANQRLDEALVKELGIEGRYNLVGNCTNPESIGHDTVGGYVDFELEITKNNTGYFCSYYKDGKLIGTQKNWGTEKLSVLDKDYVYVGIFAARNFKVSLKNTDYTLEIRDPSQDPAAEPMPLDDTAPTLNIESDAYANGTSYDLVLRNGYKGTATVKVNGTVVKENVVVGDKLDSDGNIMETIIPVTVKAGSNKIDVSFKLDDSVQAPEGYRFTTREASASKTVTYDNYLSAQKNLYVAPNGNKYGNGTKANPLDLQTAMNIAAPGQKIILVEGTYKSKSTLQSPRGVNGTKDNMIYMIADPEAKSRPVLDFEGTGGIGMQIRGNYWYLQGFDVIHAGNNGLRIDGSNCVVDGIDAYKNYGTGISIQIDSKFSRLMWPANNLIKNCNAYYNADAGEEDADGFSAKFTVGAGNVFDNCVAYCNADDGWDLYGRNYPVEPVTIQNCVCYKNGYREDGSRGAGNGNGFKLGGDNNAAAHLLINSVSFMNGADGITCNSSPNIIVKNCTSYKNDKSGISLYTKASNTNFESAGVISYKNGSADSFQPAGSQDVSKVDQTYWNGANGVADDWFKSLEFKGSVARNADGSINMEGFLELTDKAPKSAGGVMAAVASDKVTVTADSDVPNPRTGFVPFAVVAIVLAGAGLAVCVFKRKRRA